jgi:hypothetical protein
MIYVGIDVAKEKHDCFITNSDGFQRLLSTISLVNGELQQIIRNNHLFHIFLEQPCRYSVRHAVFKVQ